VVLPVGVEGVIFSMWLSSATRQAKLPLGMPIFPAVGTFGTKVVRKLLSRRSSVGRAADS
jgi:hypothetical protein